MYVEQTARLRRIRNALNQSQARGTVSPTNAANLVNDIEFSWNNLYMSFPRPLFSSKPDQRPAMKEIPGSFEDLINVTLHDTERMLHKAAVEELTEQEFIEYLKQAQDVIWTITRDKRGKGKGEGKRD